MRLGITLGKYAPLHKGHQMVIETALKEMDKVVVIIYNAKKETDIPLEVRAGWITTLYPDVKVILAPDGPVKVGNTAAIKKVQEDYVIKRLGIKKADAFYSSEFYGEHMSLALGAKNRLVDPGRKTVPVSGTKIRSNPYRYRRFLENVVYRNHITNIVFLGAPSTGKTTLAEALAKEYKTVCMPEYGRVYWERHQVNRRLTHGQLLELAQEHLRIEDAKVMDADKYLFTDTNTITTYMFSKYYHGKVHKELAELARAAEQRYDLVFVCDVDIPYDDTWDRSGDVSRKQFQKEIIRDLKKRKIKFMLLKGSVKQRIKTVKQVLKKFSKYPLKRAK